MTIQYELNYEWRVQKEVKMWTVKQENLSTSSFVTDLILREFWGLSASSYKYFLRKEEYYNCDKQTEEEYEQNIGQ